MSWIIEKRKKGNEIWVSTSTGLNGQLAFRPKSIIVGEGYDEREYKRSMELAKVIVKALNEYEQTRAEQEGWVCKHCGKSTYENDYEHLFSEVEHIGCALKAEK